MKIIHRLKKKWKFWKLGAVERYYFELKDNNTFPFQDLGDGKAKYLHMHISYQLLLNRKCQFN